MALPHCAPPPQPPHCRLHLAGHATKGLCKVAGLVLVGWLCAPWQALATLDVEQVAISHPKLNPGKNQLVQITLRNDHPQSPIAALVDVRLEDHNGRFVHKPLRRTITTRAGERQRVFFRFGTPKVPGHYTLRVEVLNTQNKTPLLHGKPVFRQPFEIIGLAKKGRKGANPKNAASRSQTSATGRNAAALRLAPNAPSPKFSPVDLVWESLHTPVFTLIGEPVRLRAELRNVGGDLARSIEIEVQYVDERNPRRRANLSRTEVEALAPGEKVELEFSALLPLNTPTGRYVITLHADPRRILRERRRKNNIATSSRPVRLSLIEQEFPRTGFVFEAQGLFVFRWRSRLFKEFKVEISAYQDFLDKKNSFQLPQGDLWVNDQEIIPLEGELPGMAHSLMRKTGVDTLYWRVVGRDQKTGLLEYSPALPFSVALPQVPLPNSRQESLRAAPNETPLPREVPPRVQEIRPR